MRKVIGIGETIMDFVIKNEKPQAAVPGGSVFNSLISLGRMGVQSTFISETGNDRAGSIILRFLKENGVNTDFVCVYDDGRTPISLAWLNDDNDAEYEFFKNYPKCRLDILRWPRIERDDIVMMSSYFVLNPALRTKVKEFLDYASQQGAIIYYDFNFRSSHRDEVVHLYADIKENMEYADIVRGSTEDLMNMFGCEDAETVFGREVEFYCRNMICTDGGKDVTLLTPDVKKNFPVKEIETVSTIGAGDNFNAGVVYGLLMEGVMKDEVNNIRADQWERIMKYAIDFSAEVCGSMENYIARR